MGLEVVGLGVDDALLKGELLRGGHSHRALHRHMYNFLPILKRPLRLLVIIWLDRILGSLGNYLKWMHFFGKVLLLYFFGELFLG